jgi:Gpi18-like mannosyltransferase
MEELGLIEKLFSNVVILISVIGFIKNAISLYFLTKYKYPENTESIFDVTNYNNELEKLQYNGVMYVILIGAFYCYLNGICPVGRRGYMFY